MMFGVQSANYGHWFLEFLPRMLVYEDENCCEDSPIIIDANMPRSHLDLLQLLNVRKRPVIQLKPDTAVHFERLSVAPGSPRSPGHREGANLRHHMAKGYF